MEKMNRIYLWRGFGYFLDNIETSEKEMNIEQLAYLCLKENKGSFTTIKEIEKEANENGENASDYEDEFYYNNECYCYCDMSQYGLENGYLLIENLKCEGVEIHS